METRKMTAKSYPIVENWSPTNSRGMDIDFGLEKLKVGQAIVVPSTEAGATKLKSAIKEFNDHYKGRRVITHHTQKNELGKKFYVAWCQK